jgi:hypothetical protein
VDLRADNRDEDSAEGEHVHPRPPATDRTGDEEAPTQQQRPAGRREDRPARGEAPVGEKIEEQDEGQREAVGDDQTERRADRLGRQLREEVGREVGRRRGDQESGHHERDYLVWAAKDEEQCRTVGDHHRENPNPADCDVGSKRRPGVRERRPRALRVADGRQPQAIGIRTARMLLVKSNQIAAAAKAKKTGRAGSSQRPRSATGVRSACVGMPDRARRRDCPTGSSPSSHPAADRDRAVRRL